MKIVVDTNIFISGIFWKGLPSKILALWEKNKIVLVATNEIVDEYINVINRITSEKDKRLSIRWKNYIQKNIIIIKNNKKNNKISRDKDDDKFVQCALSGKIKYIVSGDNDLLVLKRYKTVKILTTKEFLNIIDY